MGAVREYPGGIRGASAAIPDMPSAPRDILLLLEPSTSWSRGILRGINNYAMKFGPWQFVADGTPPGGSDIPPGWRGDGAVGKLSLQHLPRFKRLRVPAVNTAAQVMLHKSVPSVVVNYALVGKVGAEYLLSLGLENFGFFGGSGEDAQLAGFRATLRQARCDCLAFDNRLDPGGTLAARRRKRHHRMLKWLRALPKPIGIHTTNDANARLVIQSCISSGIGVPEEVAVLGVSNDTVICEMCHPPITSIALATERQGFEAAQLLDQLMNGLSPPREPILIDPLHVEARQSTNMLAINNADISKAAHFIRVHGCDPIRVEDVLDQVSISRSLLERQFQKVFGRTPAEEIRRIRMDKVKYLLTHSGWTMNEIASAAGFSTAEYMANRFHRATGLTPRGYRRQMRRQPPS